MKIMTLFSRWLRGIRRTLAVRLFNTAAALLLISPRSHGESYPVGERYLSWEVRKGGKELATYEKSWNR